MSAPAELTPGLDAVRMLWGLLQLKQRLERLPVTSLSYGIDQYLFFL